ncbi:MAG: hypothetical protein KDB07_13770, partial [Planctomycetes bacterium]|nr:hypothetical protein [Planctomycetota bacterium]
EWQLQGYIEDAQGRLRLQTDEEHRFCMGCHGSVGVTVDSTFSFARKLPGLAGWKPQDPRGIPDVPQVGHAKPEYATYLERVRGGDEFRSNTEMIERFINSDGSVKASEAARAAIGGDRDIAWMIAPSRERALALTKAYMALVRRQDFVKGRDTLLAPPQNVHPAIENGDTELGQVGMVFQDGRLWLDWTGFDGD